MDKLFFWVLIGALGFLLYISPGYFIHRMYEGFAPASAISTNGLNAGNTTQVNLQPSAPPSSASPTQNQLQNLMELLNTSPPLASPTAPPTPAGNATSGTQQPVEYETMRSRPESTRTLPGASEALKQGDLYKTTLPRSPQPGQQGMIGAMGTQPRVPAERIVYIEREPQETYERPAVSPNCPDMRDYIRKDSIPCWGCKLR